MSVEKRLDELGIELPKTPKPVAEYIPAKKYNNLIFVSGQGPIKDGEFVHIGKLGREVTLEEGYESAQVCAINALAAIKSEIGTLDNIKEIIKVKGYVNSMPDFLDQPKVVNGASELLVNIFGEKGKHSRSALGTSVLPGDIPVELEMIVEVKK